MISTLIAAMPRRLPFLGVFMFVLLASGCVFGPRIVTPEPPPIPDGGPPVPETNEVVLSDNTQLVANAPFGHIKIEAGPGLKRVFTWNGVRRGAIMKPRERRFAGSLGITYNGKPPVWQTAQGVNRLRYEEAQRRFENIDDAMIWMQIRRLHYAYNNEGIAVGWRQKGDILHVELWQFYIDGKQPTSMPNSDDSAIDISPLVVVPQKMRPQLVSNGGRSEPTPAGDGSGADNNAGTDSDTAPEPKQQNWFQRLFNGNKEDNANDAAAGETKAEADAGTQAATPAADAGAETEESSGDK